jgi:hypothetical protein
MRGKYVDESHEPFPHRPPELIAELYDIRRVIELKIDVDVLT